MNDRDRSGVLHRAKAEAAIPIARGEHAIRLLLHRGTLTVKLSQPVPPNRQTPHEQDGCTLWLVVEGAGSQWEARCF
jgi:hypothetical protein